MPGTRHPRDLNMRHGIPLNPQNLDRIRLSAKIQHLAHFTADQCAGEGGGEGDFVCYSFGFVAAD